MSPEANKAKARRRRVVFVDERFVLSLLSRGFIGNQFVSLPEPLGLPDTATAVGVWTDYQRSAFAIVVEDESFDEIPNGQMIPEMTVLWTTVEIDRKHKPQA